MYRRRPQWRLQVALCVIVMSALMVEYGHLVCMSEVGSSGWKEVSNGCAVMSLILICLHSMSSLVEC